MWESLLPAEALVMPAELSRVDELLDDPAFFEPFRPFFHPTAGRQSVPMETFLRLMYLKYRYRIGFESLCREVTDSVSWSRFCRIPLGGRAPDHSTLKKIAKRCGVTAVQALNQALLEKAAKNRVLRTNRLRADTTVVPGDVGYPTDSGLMARGVARLAVLVGTLHVLGLATRTKLRDRSRSMRRRAHDIGAWLRRRTDVAKEEAKATTAEMATIAEASLAEAKKVAGNARRGLRRGGDAASGKARAKVGDAHLAPGPGGRPDATAAVRGGPRRGKQARLAPRPRRKADKERPHRQTGRVRLPRPGRGQRGRRRGRPQCPCGQPI